jgi:hypothetical protein
MNDKAELFLSFCFGFFATFVLVSQIEIFNYALTTSTKYTTKKRFNENVPVDPNFKIFFVHTDGIQEHFDYRQLCSIESTARNNPDAIVNVQSVKTTFKQQEFFKQYSNIKYEQVNLAEAFAPTPLRSWWKERLALENKTVDAAHTANALRLALIYQHGGLYSDLDTIALRSFRPLFSLSGVFFFENPPNGLTNTFFMAKKEHPFLKMLMQSFAKEYSPSDVFRTGPNLITTNLQAYCKAEDLSALGRLNRTSESCDVVVYPHSYYSPFNSSAIASMFDPKQHICGPEFENTHVVNFNASVTGGLKVSWGSQTYYELFASLNCPLVENLAKMGS